ncbi:hypothetical protein SO802_027957 [Lithocarpus litseifolius]|uniref:F-box domain-containing protein n=1 Tax=Lithocarpus litseifolius TaxID=425828 RepID=A0AAW2BQE8_9ROSI
MSDNLPAKVSKSLFTKEEEEEEEEEVAMCDFLPSEILFNILLLLPTKSIVKFTSVCKTWRSLIRNPDFISAHLKLSNHNQPLLLFRFDFPFLTQDRLAPFGVVGTCNGLVCVMGDGFSHRIILWNPCVRMFVELPKPNVTNQSYGEWSMVTTALPGAVRLCDPLPFVNGALHWVALRRTNYNKYRNFITVLNLGEMVFSEIALPILLDDNDNGDESQIRPFISAYGNSLALFQEGFCTLCQCLRDQDINDIIDVDHAYGYIHRAKGFRKSGEIVVQLDFDQWFV